MSWSQSNGTVSIDTQDIMQVEYVEFDVETTPSDSFEGNETDFNNYLMNLSRRFRNQ